METVRCLEESMYDTSGVYRYVTSSIAGCDSIVTLNLTIKDLNVGDTTILVACDSAEWNGVMYDTSGVYSRYVTECSWL